MIVIRIAPIIYKVFVAFILLISLFALKHRDIWVFGKVINYADVLLMITLICLAPLALKKLPNTEPSGKLVKYLYFIFFYAFLASFWAKHPVGYWYTFYQLLLMFVSISIPYLTGKITNDKHINYQKMISNFSLVLSIIFLVYIIQREDVRLGGYLGTAALIGAVMIPVLAVHFHNLLNRKRIIISLAGFLITLFAALLTESRVTLVMLVLFISITLLRKPSLKRMSIVFVLVLLFIFFIFDNISTERYQELLVDESRQIALQTSLDWATHSPAALFFGNGYGSIWQWHAFQLEVLPSWQFPLENTDYGYVLFHAHSVFNQLIAELGLIGTVPFFLFIYQIFKITYKSWKAKNELKTDIMVSIICTLPALFSDLMLFRNWEVTIVWLFFVFTAANYPYKKETKIKDESKKAETKNINTKAV